MVQFGHEQLREERARYGDHDKDNGNGNEEDGDLTQTLHMDRVWLAPDQASEIVDM